MLGKDYSLDIHPDSPWRCEICGGGLKPDDAGTAKRVTAWLKNGTTTAKKPSAPLAWAHWVCIEMDGRPAELQGESLF